MTNMSFAPCPIRSSEDRQEIEARLLNSQRVALFLKFDGTVSEIVPQPDDAVMAPGIQPAIESLIARPDFTVAFVSGRALSDLREKVGLKDVIYIGNHGLEIEAGSTRFREPNAEALRRELRSLSLQLQLALSETDGLEIEDKGLTLSVHFRRVADQLQDWVRRVTFSTVERSRSFVCREGKMVLEIRPQVEWNKGIAVQWILREALGGSPLAIYLGDDITDEDAFEAIAEGITIKVGEPGESNAKYCLPDVAAVGDFLQWLNQAKPHASLATAQRAGR